MSKKVPLTIVTGFLGVGKTTLINYILNKNTHLKIALIVNEFGDVALESQFINKTNEEIVEMSNGCMCCVVRKDIISTVQGILEKRPDIDYIIVEASGLSDPVPIAQTFLMNMEDTIRLDSVLCVVDCLNIEKNFEQFEIALAQIQYADIVLLSKHTMIDSEMIEKVEKIIYKFSPYARVLKITDDLPLDLIIDTNDFEHEILEGVEIEDETHHTSQPCCHHDHDHHKEHHNHGENCGCGHHHEHKDCHHEHHHEHHHEAVDEVFIKEESPITMEKFTHFLKGLPKGVYRGKGYLYSADEEVLGKKLLFQYVGARIDVIPTEWKEGEKKRNALLFIGKGYSTQEVTDAFHNCTIY